ncbi:hypothetical protein [Streptomyces filamentosus]|uniref:hypothetical protein n=1 Tax=Streptomyces filamentosus TaxID=67294 RepID=UPI0033CC5AB1
MTARRRSDAEPTTPDLHEQWTASRLEAATEELVDLVGAFFIETENPTESDVPPAVTQ